MKRVIWIAVFCGLIFPLPAQEFTEASPSGHVLTYKVTSKSTVALVPPKDGITSDFAGDVVVPPMVKHNGHVYMVNELAPAVRDVVTQNVTFTVYYGDDYDVEGAWSERTYEDTVITTLCGVFDPWFDCSQIRSVTLPATVKRIGARCLDGLSEGDDGETEYEDNPPIKATLTLLSAKPPTVADTCARIVYDEQAAEYVYMIYSDAEDVEIRGTLAEVARQACPRGVTLCVPAGSAKDYRNDPYWNRYVEIREVKQ